MSDVKVVVEATSASDDAQVDAKPASDERRSGILGASFNFANSIVGAGIIGMPFALKRTGLYGGCLLLVLVAYLSMYSSRLLVSCAHKLNLKSFESTCRHVFGKAGYNCVLICMTLFAFGGMVAYLILVGSTFTRVAAAAFGDDSIFADRHVIVLSVSVVFILPLSLARNISSLSHFSMLGLASVAVIIIAVALRAPGIAWHYFEGSEPIIEKYHSVLEPTLFAGIGAMSFAFVCNHNSFIVFNSMSSPTPQRWRGVSAMSVGFALVLSLALGLAGAINFGQFAQPDILNNFPEDDILIIAARIMLGVSMVMTYPMEMFVARHCLLEVASGEEGGEHSFWKHAAASLFLWTSTMVIAMTVPDFGVVLELTGALTASCLGYILPGLIYLRIVKFPADAIRAWQVNPATGTRNEPDLRKRLYETFKDIGPAFLVVFGAVALVAGTSTALTDLAGPIEN